MYTMKIGTTNVNNLGANLTDAHLVVNPSPKYGDNSVSDGNDVISATSAYWNAPESKEIEIVAENVDVNVTDYVDASIDLSMSTEDVNVAINNAKRGEVETGSGDDKIEVSVQSNGSGWSNYFEIDSGAGNDVIKFTGGEGSENTIVNIDAGAGNDYINLSGLEAGSTRFVNAGSGNDIVIGSDGVDIVFGGDGVDAIATGAGNDKISGGAGSDFIAAGCGNDVVYYDADDYIVSGGQGFDGLIVAGDVDVTTNTVGFEAFIANDNSGSVESLTVDLQDGMIIALGQDDGDSVTFTDEDVTFTTEGETFGEHNEISAEGLLVINTQGYTLNEVNSLVKYTVEGSDEVVWSDVDLTAGYMA